MELVLLPEFGLENESENFRQDASGVGQTFARLDQHHGGPLWMGPSLSRVSCDGSQLRILPIRVNTNMGLQPMCSGWVPHPLQNVRSLLREMTGSNSNGAVWAFTIPLH